MNIDYGPVYWFLASAIGFGLFQLLRHWYANDQYPWRAQLMLLGFFIVVFPLKFVVCVLAMLYVFKLMGISIKYYSGSSYRG